MGASAVFRRMLEMGLREEREGRVVLEDKSASDFAEVLRHINTLGGRSPPDVCADSVNILIQWADEYQIETLRDRCEAFLLKAEPPSLDGLRQALRYDLSRRREQCLEALSKDLPRHKAGLREFLREPAVLEALWPALRAAAGLQPGAPAEVVSCDALELVWPFVEAALDAPAERSAAVAAANAAAVSAAAGVGPGAPSSMAAVVRRSSVRQTNADPPRDFFAGALCAAATVILAILTAGWVRFHVPTAYLEWAGLWLGSSTVVVLMMCYSVYLALTDQKYGGFGESIHSLASFGLFVGWALAAPGLLGGLVLGGLPPLRSASGTPLPAWCGSLALGLAMARLVQGQQRGQGWPFPPSWAVVVLCALPAGGALLVGGAMPSSTPAPPSLPVLGSDFSTSLV